MAYLTQFDHDLFISYRRASNAGADAWVDSFCDGVRVALKDLVGDVAIWRDTAELHAGQAWRPEIASAVDGAGIFVALVSRTYFDSDECRREIDRFLGRLKGPDSGGRRLLPVYKHPPKPEQQLPAELAEIGHHEFFDREPKPWHELDPRRDADAFQERLGRVVFDLMDALESLHGQQRRRARGTVFVASVGPELAQARERLRTDLRQRGWLVVPEHEYLWNADDHAQRISDDLAGAQLCVHLVARSASVEPLTPARSRLQLALAHARMAEAGRPAPLVWVQDAAATAPACQELIDFIEGTLANEGVDYLQGSLEALKTLILERLPAEAPATAAASPDAAAPAAAAPLALLVEEADLPGLGPLKALLTEQLGVELRPLKCRAGVPQDAARLARTLAGCTQALLVWGSQDEEAVFDLIDRPELAAHRHPDRLCVLCSGAPSAEKAGLRTRAARIVQATGGDGQAGLRQFLAAAPPPAAGP